MTDINKLPTKELLDLAAKAIGIELNWNNWDGEINTYFSKETGFDYTWLPHLRDGDAFRIASDLRLIVDFSSSSGITVKYKDYKIEVFVEVANTQTEEDYRAAARLAITRCAAMVQIEREKQG